MKQSEIEQLLPEILQRTVRSGGPLHALLAVMEDLHAPSETTLDELEKYVDPYRTPDRFVPYLARWVDLDRLLPESTEDTDGPPHFPSGLGRLRELVAVAAFLSKWRGTRRGLLAFLETATGIDGFQIREQAPGTHEEHRPYHLDIQVPPDAAAYRELIEQIVEMEKPAYVTYELQFEEEE
jgi:phage tail-like protein